MPTAAERLIPRLRELGLVIPEGTELHRTYAGRTQRAQGAWSWFLYLPGQVIDPDVGSHRPEHFIGSHWPASYLVTCERLISSTDADGSGRSISIDPAGDHRLHLLRLDCQRGKAKRRDAPCEVCGSEYSYYWPAGPACSFECDKRREVILG